MNQYRLELNCNFIIESQQTSIELGNISFWYVEHMLQDLDYAAQSVSIIFYIEIPITGFTTTQNTALFGRYIKKYFKMEIRLPR